MKKKIQALGWVLLFIAIAFAIELGVGVLIAILIGSLGYQNGLINQADFADYYQKMLNYIQSGGVMMIINTAIDGIFLACFGTWYYLTERKYDFKPNYKKAFSKKNILCIAGIGFFGQYAANLLMGITKLIMPAQFQSYEKLAENFNLTTLPPVVMILIVCIIGPIAEECIFRGMIYGKLRRTFTMWPSMLISGVLFGIFHMNWIQGIYASVFGVVLAFVCEKTGTLLGAVFLHIVFNSASYIIAGYESMIQKTGLDVPEFLFLLIEAVSAVLVVILLKKVDKNMKKNQDTIKMEVCNNENIL